MTVSAPTDPPMITVRYFAGARGAAGVAEERVTDAATLRELVAALSARHGPRLARVLAVASFLVDGVARRDPDQTLAATSVVDVLPPFAGG